MKRIAAKDFLKMLKEINDIADQQMILEIEGRGIVAEISDKGNLTLAKVTLIDPEHRKALFTALKEWYPDEFK